MKLQSLPIDSHLPRILNDLTHHGSLVLKAAPGSGKTTRVPPAILALTQKEILVLEPRRLAAKYSALRVASELGEEIGRRVGYQFRFENVGSPQTRLRFLTEGMLMRRLMSDPELKTVDTVILDEFHERHIHSDIALSYLRNLQKNQRPDLRIIVMSATLDTEELSRFLGNAPVIEVAHRPFPVSAHYLPSSNKYLEIQVRDAVLRALEESDSGDILVFLPGMGEIRRAQEALDEYFSGNRDRPKIFSLHGELTREEQDQAIRPLSPEERGGRRKVILSTNVAETSLTIEGIATVIDSGLHRIATYSWWSGVPALKTRPISKASAIQRMGRAGRTQAGRCYRLYSQAEFDSRPAFEVPEIQRADLSQSLLELKAMAPFDLEHFEWFDSPSANSMQAAWTLLYRLGAIAEPKARAPLTPLGKKMAQLPAHPRIARFLIEALHRHCFDDAATLSVLITEGQLEWLDPLECIRRARLSDYQRRAVKQWSSGLENSGKKPPAIAKEAIEIELRKALLTGFPDRVSRRRKASGTSARDKAGSTEIVFSSGGSATVEENSHVLDSELFVALEVRELQRQGQTRPVLQVNSLSPIEMDWLLEIEPCLIEDRVQMIWSQERGRVLSSSQTIYNELVLEERIVPASPSKAAGLTLLRAVLGLDPAKLSELSTRDWLQAFSHLGSTEAIEETFARLELLKKYFPESPIQTIANLTLIFEKHVTLADLKSLNWPEEIIQQLLSDSPDIFSKLERGLPLSLKLPSGRSAKIHYALDKAPWVESRLQDFFGMKTAPTLLDGKLPLTLHLLAPNYRAIQVTTDLAGFWQRGYQEQRNALSRRYPRHAWPENPLEIVRDQVQDKISGKVGEKKPR